MRVVVVGCGVAGTSAAVAAKAAGAGVTLIDGGTGASWLASGALDFEPWETARATEDAALEEPPVARVLGALDAYAIAAAGAILATTGGILRPARGRDLALLDLSTLNAGAVLVPRADHTAWEAGALARSWNDTRLARERGLEFVAADATLARFVDERQMPHADVAARHDDPARISWLAARIRDALNRSSVARISAVLLPPWLGIERARAAALSQEVGLPCGEALMGPGGPAGLRFAHARDRALASLGIAIVSGRVTEVARRGDEWSLLLEPEARGEPLTADRVVLATGGLVGGGLAYTPSAAILAGELPPRARESFASTVDAPVTIGAGGCPLALPGSLFGEPPEALAWPFTSAPLLERAGVLTSASGHAGGGLYAAGDLVADRARTWLCALAQGARAGDAAARA